MTACIDHAIRRATDRSFSAFGALTVGDKNMASRLDRITDPIEEIAVFKSDAPAVLSFQAR